MTKKTSHLRNYSAIGHSSGSHQLHFSEHTAKLLKEIFECTDNIGSFDNPFSIPKPIISFDILQKGYIPQKGELSSNLIMDPCILQRQRIERLITKELTQTFVHKKTHNSNISNRALSKKLWNEMTYVNKVFAILYQDFEKKISKKHIKKIWHMIDSYSGWQELEKNHPLPKLLQDPKDIHFQGLEDILQTIRWIKKQRTLFSAVRTKKLHLNGLIL